MKHTLTRLALAALAALTLGLLLTACSPKPLEEGDIVSQLRRSGAFLPGEPEIEGYEILDRVTDKKGGTDTVTLTVSVEEDIEAELTYVLTFAAVDGEWELQSVERDEDGPWELEGPTRRELTAAAKKKDEYLRDVSPEQVEITDASEADDFDPEEGEYAKTVTLTLKAASSDDIDTYTAEAKASYTLTEDGWELDRWRTTDTGFVPTVGPDESVFMDALEEYSGWTISYDDMIVTNRGKDLDAGTAWARLVAVGSYGPMTVSTLYRVDARYSHGSGWEADPGSVEAAQTQVTWDSIFPVKCASSWSDARGDLTIESADGLTLNVSADLATASYYGSHSVRTDGTVAVELESSPDFGGNYLFRLDGESGFFRLDPMSMTVYWYYEGFDSTWGYIILDPVFNAAEIYPEPLPAEALDYWSFDSAEGLTTVHQIPRPVESELTGVGTDDFDIVESKHEIMLADGPVGRALYLDGRYGVKLDMNAPADDSYTIAFWYNGDRFVTLGPILQLGRNIGMVESADPASAVAWFNICQSDWGANGDHLTPTVWDRNSSIGTYWNTSGVWPWMAPNTVYGKQEWAHVAIVVDGVRYFAEDGIERIGCKLYINGELMCDANAFNMSSQGVAPEIFQHLYTAVRGLEAYIGINYWTPCYKGFIDELYVYDEALTAGQVLSLYELGDPSVNSVSPEYTGPTDDGESGDPGVIEPIDPDTLTAAPVDVNAVDVIGTPDRSVDFWTDTSDGFKVEDGGTVTLKMNNYSDARYNWDNFILGFSNTAVTTDKLAGADDFEGYAEWFVLRADAYGWAPEGRSFLMAYEEPTEWMSWLNLMTDAEVTAVITRNGGEIAVDYTFTGADGTVMTENVVVISDLTAADPCYVHVSADHAYVEILSVTTG